MNILKLIDEIYKEIIHIYNSTETEEIIIDSFEITKECLDYIKSKDEIFIKLFIDLIKSYIYINQEKEVSKIIIDLKKYGGLDNTFIDYIESNIDEIIYNSNTEDSDLEEEDTYAEEIEEIEQTEEYFEIENNQKLNKNQIDAISNMIKQNYCSGIVNQSVGAGKSFIILSGINEHYKKYNSNGKLYIITCPRKEVLKKMFFTTIKDEDNKEFLVLSPENIKNWNKFDVIDINKFNIIERVETKKRDILLDINKPNILVVNTDYLKTLHSNDKINYKLVNFIMFDECHGVSAKYFYEMLFDVKYVYNIHIIGFSATPIRDKAEDKVKTIFSKSMNSNKDQYLNIISNYDIMDAIKDNVILPPNITIMEINKTCNKKIGKTNKELTEKIIRKLLSSLPYKKFIGWCGTISRMKEWYKFFKEKFPEFVVFCSTSQDKQHKGYNTNFEGNKKSFYEMKSNCILLVVNRCREGSDIPNVDCGIYLDMVKKRGILVAIQTSGRVLRHDDEHKKKVGNIIDTFINQGKIEIEIMTAGMLINYYERVLNLSIENHTDVIEKYSMMRKIFNETKFEQEKNKITVKIDDTHDTVINLELTTKNFDWSKFKEKISSTIVKKVNITEDDKMKFDFNELKNQIKNMFLHKLDYINYANINNLIINPDIIYKDYGWLNWYDFLGIDISIYPENKTVLLGICKKYNINSKELYEEKACLYNLPLMPDELYKNFTSYYNEFEEISLRRK